MDERRPGKLKVWTPLLFALVMIFGMTLGFNLRDSLRNKRDIRSLGDRNDRLEQIIDLIREKYVDTVSTNLLYQDAIAGILSHLDPHTVYIPSDDLQEVNEGLEGSFFGIGVEFSIIRDTIQVTSIVEQGPAERAGVDIGDQLIKVGDSTVAGTGITSERIIKLLRGKQYSKALVTLRSSATGAIKKAIIQRDIVPLYSVDASIMLDSITAFIKINRFSATTYDEFAKALKSLRKRGAKKLILDLRQNPGGYLGEATSIGDELLPDDRLMVYTKGVHSSRTDYKAGEPGMFERGRLAILVDEGSASASEVLAGAVQDWDRGVIIGRRTFGKGLVQEQFDLEDGSALRLTIARYYTPSGRSIQRSFAKGKEAYAADIGQRYDAGELTGKDSVRHADTTTFYTFNKRRVYGGGGIVPDVYVPYDTGRLNGGLLNIIFSESFKNMVWDYYIHHSPLLKQYRSVSAFDAGFNAGELVDGYPASLPAEAGKAATKLLASPGNRAYFAIQVKAQLARLLFHNNGYYSIYATQDNMVQKAVEILKGPQYLTILNR